MDSQDQWEAYNDEEMKELIKICEKVERNYNAEKETSQRRGGSILNGMYCLFYY